MNNKEKILKYFRKNHLISAKDLILQFPEINRATIYRNINRLVEDDIIQQVDTIQDEAYYELTEAGHFGHFICKGCGEVEELQIDNTVLQKIVSRNQIESTHIQINVKGTCSKCN